MPINLKYFSYTTIWLSLIILIFMLADRNIGTAFNADALYLPVLLNNLIDNGGHIRDWYLPPSPYFFPDFIIFYLAYAISKNVFIQVVIYAILQTLLFQTLLIFLLRRININNGDYLATISTLLAVAAALLLGNVFQYILISAHHFSIINLSMALIILVLIHTQNKILNYTSAILIFFISIAAGFSDALFMVQVAIPIFITGLANYLINKNEDSFFAKSIVSLVGFLVGYFSYPSLIEHKTRYTAQLGFTKLITFINNYHLLVKFDLLNIIILIIFFGIFPILLFLFRERVFITYLAMNKNMKFLCLFITSSLAMNSIVILFTQNIIASDRYFIPMGMTSIICVTIFVFNNVKVKEYVKYISTIVVLAIICRIMLDYKQNGLNSYYNPKVFSCINNLVDKYHLKFGMSGYWAAKHLQALTSFKIQMAQFNYEGNEYKWITNDQYFQSNQTFFVINTGSPPPEKINYELMTKLNGLPAVTAVCSNTEFYIYHKKIRTH